MKTNGRFLAYIAALMMLAIPGLSSSAVMIIDLSGDEGGSIPLGKTGSATATYSPGVEAHGYYLPNPAGNWEDADLYRRIEVGDRGLGICNPDEQVAFPEDTPPGNCGGGDVNELDNMDLAEIITLKLPDGYKWVSVDVSSMDNDTPVQVETARLYADADGIPNGTTPGSLGDTTISDIFGAAIVEQNITIPPANATAPYLMFEPVDVVDGIYDDNDFLVWKATIEELPPPPTDGCTPGFWKQAHHFPAWVGYTPGQQFSSVFEDAFPSMTLRQVLKQGGGGLKALGRHTVAALLNGANSDINYYKTDAEVIAAFNAVHPGTKRQYNRLKRKFSRNNELGCPINGKSAPVPD